MYATGAVLLPFFSFMTFLIAVPTGVKFFNWIGTMWKGQLTFESPMLFSVGFLVTFLFGGLSGVLLASPPIDFHVTDTYFVVAHFHYVLFGTIVFATYAGIYFWFPKMTGRMMDERLGKWHFWTTFVGFHAHVPRPALARRRRHAASLRRLPALGRLHGAELDLHDRRVRPRCVDAAVPLERLQELPLRRGRHGRRPVGLRQLARVGDHLPAAASQLHRVAAHPLASVRRSSCTTRTWSSGCAHEAHVGPGHGGKHATAVLEDSTSPESRPAITKAELRTGSRSCPITDDEGAGGAFPVPVTGSTWQQWGRIADAIRAQTNGVLGGCVRRHCSGDGDRCRTGPASPRCCSRRCRGTM